MGYEGAANLEESKRPVVVSTTTDAVILKDHGWLAIARTVAEAPP
ncbi:hypothetical protein [Bradyrhizobium sp. 142]|nr:hypothetical protein [Bradyrhizobium sp. 142]